MTLVFGVLVDVPLRGCNPAGVAGQVNTIGTFRFGKKMIRDCVGSITIDSNRSCALLHIVRVHQTEDLLVLKNLLEHPSNGE